VGTGNELPSCVTVRGVAATVTVAVRCDPVFALAETCTVAFPEPDCGATLAHDAFDEVVQLHAPLVCTATVASAPAAASGSFRPETEY
jgi:hypothetical protein